MTTPRIETEIAFESSALKSTLRMLWKTVRLPLLGILLLIEPIIKYVFGSAMVLGVLASIAFEISAVGPRFPFLAMLALSLSFGLALFLYYGLVSLLSD
jgi:hypothetical protein